MHFQTLFSHLRGFEQGAAEDSPGILEVDLQGQRGRHPERRHERVHRLQVKNAIIPPAHPCCTLKYLLDHSTFIDLGNLYIQLRALYNDH